MVAESIEKSMFSKTSEKTFIDKLLGRREAEEIRKLISKKKLTREELLNLLSLASGVQAKLLNLEKRDRYVMLKFSVWIGEFIQICETFFDHQDTMDEQEQQNPEYQEITKTIQLKLEHAAKVIITLYLNIGNTSLSIDGKFVQEAFTNKYEVNYGQQMLEAEKKRKGLFEK